ncbi:MAG: hypothetical protein E6471_24185, partial [Bradyrhizobium sp.]|nr:hypothetical protein [Bradyrhizobium sp.]
MAGRHDHHQRIAAIDALFQIGLADMAAQAGKLLDYSAHAWESFTAITLAYVFINAVIMLIMYVVERK